MGQGEGMGKKCGTHVREGGRGNSKKRREQIKRTGEIIWKAGKKGTNDDVGQENNKLNWKKYMKQKKNH